MSETIDAPLAFAHYSDATYDYYCEAPPRTALTEAVWRVSRIHKTTLREQWAAPAPGADKEGRLEFNLATSLVVVAALDYI